MPEYVTGSGQKTYPEGDYPFKINDAQLKESSTKNQMIELELIISAGGEEPITVTDYLVFSENAYWKIDAFRQATGEVLAGGEKVSFEAEDCIDRTGWCKLEIDTYQGRSRNKVAAYLDPALMDPKKTGTAPAAAASAAPAPDNGTKDDFNFGPVPAGS